MLYRLKPFEECKPKGAIGNYSGKWDLEGTQIFIDLSHVDVFGDVLLSEDGSHSRPPHSDQDTGYWMRMEWFVPDYNYEEFFRAL